MKKQAAIIEISGRELTGAIAQSFSVRMVGAFWDSLSQTLLIRVEGAALPDVPDTHLPIRISREELIERIVEFESYTPSLEAHVEPVLRELGEIYNDCDEELEIKPEERF